MLARQVNCSVLRQFNRNGQERPPKDESLDHESPLEELFEDQITCADMIILNKTDLLPVDARFQHAVSGTRGALNARIAEWLLDQVMLPDRFDMDWCTTKLTELGESLPEAVTYNRTPASDAQVRDWIVSHLGEFKRPSASAMLRAYRDAGRACEQKRFGAIFKAATAGATRR